MNIIEIFPDAGASCGVRSTCVYGGVPKWQQIQDLKKVYHNGFKAVQGINLKMYKGQIFSLLGHNGAGKSTTISMLTGLLEKSSGSGQVFGKDIFGDMKEVRKSMGVCP